MLHLLFGRDYRHTLDGGYTTILGFHTWLCSPVALSCTMVPGCPALVNSSRPRPLCRCRQARDDRSLRTARLTCRAVSLPPAVSQAVKDSSKQWLKQAVSSSCTLTDDETGSTVHLVGVSLYAPHQQRLVAAAIDELEPTHILLEQPPDQSANVVLPHPLWIQGVLDNQEDVIAATSDSYTPSQSQDGAAASLSASTVRSGLLSALQQQLAAAGHPAAKVGRDIIDPFETFGYYPGLDLFVSPSSSAVTAELCGFLPGYELVVAAERASLEGAQLLCIDAPLKLQESWVKQLLENFRLDEQQVNSYKPLRDFDDNQQLLPPAAAEWDRQLAVTAQQLQQAAAQQPTSGQPAAGSSGHAPVSAAVEQQVLLLYKVSKATAAAMLSPADTQAATARLQRLQPLKWAHFRLRQRYMAQQIREACRAAAAGSRKAAKVQQQQQQQYSHRGPASSSDRPARMLAVVGRQYVQGLVEMWRNPASSLWRDKVPRTFAESVVEKSEDFAATGRQHKDHGSSSSRRADDADATSTQPAADGNAAASMAVGGSAGTDRR